MYRAVDSTLNLLKDFSPDSMHLFCETLLMLLLRELSRDVNGPIYGRCEVRERRHLRKMAERILCQKKQIRQFLLKLVCQIINSLFSCLISASHILMLFNISIKIRWTRKVKEAGGRERWRKQVNKEGKQVGRKQGSGRSKQASDFAEKCI